MAKKQQMVATVQAAEAQIETAPPVYHGLPPEVKSPDSQCGPSKTFATQVELGVGAHLMGQTLTMSASRGSSLEVDPLGIRAISASGRVMLVPWTNIKCVELKPATKARKR